MDVNWTIPYEQVGNVPDPEWPMGWPPPRVGEKIVLVDNSITLVVSDVEWYPQGNFGSDPFVDVTLALPRPSGYFPL